MKPGLLEFDRADYTEARLEVFLYTLPCLQKQRSRRAWIGTGGGFGANLLLIVGLLGV